MYLCFDSRKHETQTLTEKEAEKMNWIKVFFNLIWPKVSPQLRESIVNFVKELEKKAAATPNAVDDIAVAIIKLALGID